MWFHNVISLDFGVARECILAPSGGEFLRPQGYLRQQRPRSSDQSYAGEFSRTKRSVYTEHKQIQISGQQIDLDNFNILKE